MGDYSSNSYLPPTQVMHYLHMKVRIPLSPPFSTFHNHHKPPISSHLFLF
ncbi:hypothetical protein KSS87_001384 [Heliosperma pusillum]|nr:hypothetical protein KSS87_010113 [Heliosperma pusillum]KAH9612162.1 hypothetical protein KSS87_001384 [Heliosperma pusillum]